MSFVPMYIGINIWAIHVPGCLILRLIDGCFVPLVQVHIRVLESSQENINLLLVGLEYLINISYVDDTEVFKVYLFTSLWFVLLSFK